MAEKRLFLIDAYAMIYRSYYAFFSNPMYNSKGFNTSTAFGFLLSLDDILRKLNPTHIAAAFDLSGPTFRHDMYPEYKANRQMTPDEIRNSVPVIRQLLDNMNIPILECPGYEADDVVGTIAKKAAGEGFDVYMVTPDKDYCQLVEDHIFIYKPKKSGNEAEIWGVKEVLEKFEITSPLQVIDILALWGDASDNVPGVPGIGEKTAKKLIADYTSVDGVLANLDKLSPKQRENFTAYRDDLILSKKLVTIDLNAPVAFNETDCLLKPFKVNELQELLSELNFKSFINKWLPNAAPQAVKPKAYTQGNLFDAAPVENVLVVPQFSGNTAETVTHEYMLLDSDEKIEGLILRIKASKEFCFDTETTGLDPHTDNLVGIAFSVKSHEGFYLQVPQSRDEAKALIGKFADVFADEEIAKIGHNLKFDILFMQRYGFAVNGKLIDTMIAHYLLKPEQNHKMDSVSEKYLNYRPIPIEELIGRKGAHQITMQHVDIQKIVEYACEDADITFQLKEVLLKEIETAGLSDLFYNIELKLLKVLIDIEYTGVKLDTSFLKEFSVTLAQEIKALEEHIFKEAGQVFNIASPKQMGDMLFEKLNIPYEGKLTKTKQYSTNEEVLQTLTNAHPIINMILEYRGLTKLLSTYVEALPKLVNPHTGHLHTSFNQTLAVTGRLSSNNPNLQNIPIREEKGREMRKAFIPSSSDRILLSADYSQIELRLMAHMSGDETMIEAFKQNADIHTSTASNVFKVPVSEVTKEMRSKAKTANFGIIYGISGFGLAQRMNIPRKEANDLIYEYFKTFPGVKKFMTDIVVFAKSNGYVETLCKRKRFLPDINSQNAVVRGMAERNAINTPIQGTAADVIKIAMCRVFDAFEANKLLSKMILQVHDELLFDVVPAELEKVKKIVKYEMEHAMQLNVPLIVETGTGKNWLEAH